ncbi:carbon storage regulator [Salinisphaera sp. T31B1]|uniref:carbon storage regulator n=1 Tax=Salinisphaera sp. T31B1 TaxID=727963 RepID=UPI003342707E
MPIIERRVGQAIRIGDEIVVEVVAARDGQVRLEVVAPRDIAVEAVDAGAQNGATADGKPPGLLAPSGSRQA